MTTRHRAVAAIACAAASVAACGGESQDPNPPARTAAPAPRVNLTELDREAWTPQPVRGDAVPVLVYRGVQPADFARHMALLANAGYETIALDELVRHVKRRQTALPARPLLLTFDGGRLETWAGTDATLAEHGFNAVLFVDVGRVSERDPSYLTWAELNRLQRSGRWDMQLQSGTGNRLIRYGPDPSHVGPFYAYRGSEEVLGGWRERTFSDITQAEELLALRVDGYRPLGFAPPFGNYGQAGTNDPDIPRELRARLLLSFELIFTQDRDGFAAPGDGSTLGRIEVTPQVGDDELRTRLAASGR
jgi:peptidoglycan/xylan/chitin deacetylase (PgdA/CDA1 family)